MTEEKPPMAEMREEVKAIFAQMKPESLAKMQALYDEYFRLGTDRGLPYTLQNHVLQILWAKHLGEDIRNYAKALRLPATYLLSLERLFAEEKQRQPVCGGKTAAAKRP
jgi:hypothetical protein